MTKKSGQTVRLLMVRPRWYRSAHSLACLRGRRLYVQCLLGGGCAETMRIRRLTVASKPFRQPLEKPAT